MAVGIPWRARGALDAPQDQQGPELSTSAVMFWVVLSLAGFVVETTLIIVLGCRATERNEPAGNADAPAEAPRAPG